MNSYSPQELYQDQMKRDLSGHDYRIGEYQFNDKTFNGNDSIPVGDYSQSAIPNVDDPPAAESG